LGVDTTFVVDVHDLDSDDWRGFRFEAVVVPSDRFS
jgi:hypothetical protein